MQEHARCIAAQTRCEHLKLSGNISKNGSEAPSTTPAVCFIKFNLQILDDVAEVQIAEHGFLPKQLLKRYCAIKSGFSMQNLVSAETLR